MYVESAAIEKVINKFIEDEYKSKLVAEVQLKIQQQQEKEKQEK